jgi:hypothetical protein
MKNIKMCSLLFFSFFSVLLSAQGKEKTASSMYKPNTGISAKDMSVKSAVYIVNPFFTLKQEFFYEKGKSSTDQILAVYGSGFTKGGRVQVLSCECSLKNDNSRISWPTPYGLTAKENGDLMQTFANINKNVEWCWVTLQDVKTGKSAQFTWTR